MNNCAIESFNLEKSFEGKNVHDQCYLFNKTILDIRDTLHNLVPFVEF